VTQFVNAVLISLVAFFAILVALGAVNMQHGGDPAPAARPEDPVTLSLLEAHWGSTPAGPSIEIVAHAHNGGEEPATVTRASYRASVDGTVVADGKTEPAVPIASGGNASVPVKVALPSTFAATWWHAQALRSEATELRVEGDIEIQQAGATQVLPYEWSSSWQGHLAKGLAAAANCGDQPGLCVAGSAASWDGDALVLDLDLRNAGSSEIVLTGGSAALAFARETTATGPMPQGLHVPPGGLATAQARLAFDDAALARWWPGHVARCETSLVAVDLHLTIQDMGEDLGGPAHNDTVAWSLVAAPLETRFLCLHQP
jgi:LEA14-like dessication related protein